MKRSRHFRWVLASTAIAALAACVSHFPAGSEISRNFPTYDSQAVVRDLVYSDPQWPEPLLADLYLPLREDARPVVMMVHGGSWSARDKADMNAISRVLVKNGYAVLNLNYRFAPTWKYPAQLADMQQALKWIADNAETYHLDLERVNTWGYSSGAHLAALIASYNYSENSLLADMEGLPRIRAVVAGGIPADLRKYEDGPIVRRFLGDSQAKLPQVYADASPAFHISANDPPVFIYHGKMDMLVKRDQPEDYFEALQNQGIDSELYLHSFRGHMTMFLFADDAQRKAIQFLNRKNVEG